MKIAYKFFRDMKRPIMFKVDFQPSNGLNHPISCVAIGLKDKSLPDQYNFLAGYSYSIMEIYDILIDIGLRAIAVKGKFDGADKEKLFELINSKIKESFDIGWDKDAVEIEEKQKSVMKEYSEKLVKV